MLTEPGGPFVDVSKLNMSKYSQRPALAKVSKKTRTLLSLSLCLLQALFEYLFHHENNVRAVSFHAYFTSSVRGFLDLWEGRRGGGVNTKYFCIWIHVVKRLPSRKPLSIASKCSSPCFRTSQLYVVFLPQALDLAALATEACQFGDWWWKIQLGKCYYRYTSLYHWHCPYSDGLPQ